MPREIRGIKAEQTKKMAKLHKSRPATKESREKKEAKPTWLGTKIDAARAKFNKKHGDKTAVTSPEEEDLPKKKSTLKSLSGFLRDKLACVPDSKETTDTLAIAPISAAQHHQASESSGSATPSDFDQALNENTICDNTSDASDESITPNTTLDTSNMSIKSDIILDNSIETPVQVPQLPEDFKARTGSCSPSHNKIEVEKMVHEALEQNDLYWQHILDNKTRQHAKNLRLQSARTATKQQQTSERHFTQLEVDKKIKAAIANNDLQWTNVSQQEKETAPSSFSYQQHEELVKMAVDQKDAYWECMIDSKREEHAGQIERLQEQVGVLQDEKLRQENTHMAKSKLETAAKDALHARQLKAKDAIAVGIGQIWQARFDQQNELLHETNEENEELKAIFERLQTDLCDETAEAAKYQRLFHLSCQVANETFLKTSNEFRQLELHNAGLAKHCNTIAAELEESTQKYVDLSQRHMDLAAEFNKESAERQELVVHNAQLREELHQTRLGTQTMRQSLAKKTSKNHASAVTSLGPLKQLEVAGLPHDGIDEGSFGPWNTTPTVNFQQRVFPQKSRATVDSGSQPSPQCGDSSAVQPSLPSSPGTVQCNTLDPKTEHCGQPDPPPAFCFKPGVASQKHTTSIFPTSSHNAVQASSPATDASCSQPSSSTNVFPTSFNFNDPSPSLYEPPISKPKSRFTSFFK